MTTPRIAGTFLVVSLALIHARAGRAEPAAKETLSRLESFASSNAEFAAALDGLEERFASAERGVEGLLRIPNLKLDARARGLRLDMLHAKTDGGLSLDVESRTGPGGLPFAVLSLGDRARSAGLRAQLSHEVARAAVGGSWNVRSASLTGSVLGDGTCRAGLTLRLTSTQSLDYSVRTGPAADHRVGWSLKVRL